MSTCRMGLWLEDSLGRLSSGSGRTGRLVPDETSIRRATIGDADAIAEIHLRSRAVAMPWLAVVHTDEETHDWVRTVVVPNDEVWVAERDGTIVGFAAVAPGWL